MLLYMVFSTICCGCGPKELVCSLVHRVCVFVSDKHVELFMIINHNSCIKLVPLVINRSNVI